MEGGKAKKVVVTAGFGLQLAPKVTLGAENVTLKPRLLFGKDLK